MARLLQITLVIAIAVQMAGAQRHMAGQAASNGIIEAVATDKLLN